MSPAELDLPVLLAPEQIRRREFVTTRRGYDPAQVRDYLEQIASQIEDMEAMLREARLEAEAALVAGATTKTDPYEEFGRRIEGVLRSADQEADRVRREVREEAGRVLRPGGQGALQVRHPGPLPWALDLAGHLVHAAQGRRVWSAAWRGTRLPTHRLLQAASRSGARVELRPRGRRHLWVLLWR